MRLAVDMHDLAIGRDMTIAASVREPASSSVTLAVDAAASASTSAVSSAYSNFDMMVVLSPTPTAMGEQMSPWSTPLAMSNGSESVIRVSEAHYSSGCRKDSLHNAAHLSADSCLCDGLVHEHLTIRVERRTVVNKSYLLITACLPEESSV